MRILLVEDDRSMAVVICHGLRDRHNVETVASGQDALWQSEHSPYDVYLLDINLADINGILLCRKLRQMGIKAPILMLTASHEVADKVAALDAGADDFLSKPFHFAELQARLRALARRGSVLSKINLIQVSEVVVNLSEGAAYHRGVRLDLRRKELLLLEYFLRHAGRVVTRNMILEQVWDSQFDPLTNTVDVHVKFLRDKVDKPFGTKHIQTIHGLGYKFAIDPHLLVQENNFVV